MNETLHPSYEFSYDPSSQVREWPDPLVWKIGRACWRAGLRVGRRLWAAAVCVARSPAVQEAGRTVAGAVIALPLLALLLPIALVYGLIVQTGATLVLIAGYTWAAACVLFVFKVATGSL